MVHQWSTDHPSRKAAPPFNILLKNETKTTPADIQAKNCGNAGCLDKKKSALCLARKAKRISKNVPQ